MPQKLILKLPPLQQSKTLLYHIQPKKHCVHTSAISYKTCFKSILFLENIVDQDQMQLILLHSLSSKLPEAALLSSVHCLPCKPEVRPLARTRFDP